MTGEKTLAVWNAETERWEDPNTGQELTEAEAFDRAKTDGDEIFKPAAKTDVRTIFMARVGCALRQYDRERWAGEVLETNGAEFYVDGYTLASTNTVEEICLRRMDSDKAVIIKSSQLVAFLDRRFDD